MNTGTDDGITSLMERVRECASRGSVLVLEGDTDVSFFNGLLGDKCPETISAEGRINALAIAANVPADTLLDAMVLTIVDSDFDRITMRGELLRFKDAIHVVFTDAHDLETTIISVEEVRRRVLTTVLRCSHLQSIAVWTRALAYQTEVSLVRLLVHQEGWGINVDGVPPRTIDDDDGRLNRGKLVAELFPRFESRSIDIEQGELMVRLGEMENFRASWPQLINGHELCKSIAIYARQLIARTISPTEIESALRVSFQLRHLASTDMARQIQRWWEAKGVSPFFNIVPTESRPDNIPVSIRANERTKLMDRPPSVAPACIGLICLRHVLAPRLPGKTLSLRSASVIPTSPPPRGAPRVRSGSLQLHSAQTGRRGTIWEKSN